MILSLVVFAVRMTLLAVFTFAFVVLFDHGPDGFVEGAGQEWTTLTETLGNLSKPSGKPVDPGT